MNIFGTTSISGPHPRAYQSAGVAAWHAGLIRSLRLKVQFKMNHIMNMVTIVDQT